jgi:XisI protein
MDKLSTYSNYVVELLETYLHPGLESPIHEHLVIDREHHHYQFLREGWVDKNTFQMGIVLHFQIKADGKIWILANWTEDDVAGELVERGVLKQDIVLAFQPESVRKLSGYAAA